MNEEFENDPELQELIRHLEAELLPIKIDPAFRKRLLEDLLELQRRLKEQSGQEEMETI